MGMGMGVSMGIGDAMVKGQQNSGARRQMEKLHRNSNQ